MSCPLPLPSSPSPGLIQTGQRQAWAAASGTQHLNCFRSSPLLPPHFLPQRLNLAPTISSHRLLAAKVNAVSHSVTADSGTPPTVAGDSPGKNAAAGCHSLLQGISGIKPRSPALQADSLSSEPPGKAKDQIKTLNNYILEKYFYYIKYFPVNRG